MRSKAVLAAENQRLAALWRDLPPARKRPYADAARELHGRLREVDGLELRNADELNQFLGDDPHSRRVAKRRLGLRALDEMVAHPAWRSGVNVQSFSAALRDDLYDDASPRAIIQEQVEQIFGYRMNPVKNPTRVLRHERVCAQLFGGLCKFDDVCGMADVVTKNMRRALQEQDIQQRDFPLLVDIFVTTQPAVTETHLLCLSFGKGEMQVFVQLASRPPAVARPAGVLALATKAGAMGDVVLVTSTQRLVRRLLHGANRASGMARTSFDSITIVAYEYEDGRRGNDDEFSLQKLRERFRLECSTRKKTESTEAQGPSLQPALRLKLRS